MTDRSRYPWTEEELDTARAMVGSGATYRVIAEALGRSYGSVKTKFRDTAKVRPSATTVPAPPPVPEEHEADAIARNRNAIPTQSDPRHDPALHSPKAPPGYHLRGVSTLLDGAGVPVQTWVKTTRDAAQDCRDAMMDALRSLPDSFRSAHDVRQAPRDTDHDLLCVYPVADIHFGMYSWAEETGSDWDVEIAERTVLAMVDELVDRAPSAEQALVASLGDFFHCDSNLARTSRSGNPLDTDTRWAKVLRVGVRTARAVIDRCLEKHKSVRFVATPGNHDDQTSVMLSLWVDAFYERDPRVTVDTSAAPFHWYRFGKCFFGITHGDTAKPDKLGQLMAAKRPADWAASTCRRWLTGHRHSQRIHEFPGVKVECFGTPAPTDAWANRDGYMASRDMRVDVYHRERGRRGEFMTSVEDAA